MSPYSDSMTRRIEQTIGNWAALGPVVRAARTRAGLTQASLADQADVSRGWLIRFEAGLPNAEPVTVFRLLRTLDLELTISARAGADEMFDDLGPEPAYEPGPDHVSVDIEAILAELDSPTDENDS